MSEILKVTSPWDGRVLKEIPMHSREKSLAMLDRAVALFDDPNRTLDKSRRLEILEKLVYIMSSRKEELVRTAASEGGKPWKDTLVEVDRAIQGVKLSIHHLHVLGGEEVPMGQTAASQSLLAFTVREPVGVVLSISAFNHPLNLAVHQVIPAIAVGCPVLIKPARSTPLSALALADMLKEAGLPDDWCQVMICGGVVAEELVKDSRIRFFSFIGSGKVGWRLRSLLAPGVGCALEHGGVAPVIVDENADFIDMIPLLAKGGFYHAGQVCVSVQRVYVLGGREENVASAIAREASALKVGDALDTDTDVGPLISTAEVDRVDQWVKEAVSKGAELLCGGNAVGKTAYEPTVLLNPSDDALVSRQEIFGPVVCVYSCASLDEGIARANALPFSFQSAVFTKNLDVALKCSRRLKATAVMVNDHTAFRVDWMPFGGSHESGQGLGGIPYSMEEMTKVKMTVIRSAEL